MAKVTIFGAGITGMAIAYQLPKGYEVTIVARDLPGDTPSQDWASPWACAGWVALGGSPREQQMQLDAATLCSKLAMFHPESSVRRAELTDIYDAGVPNELWYRDRVPGFQQLNVSEDSGEESGAIVVKYPSFVLNPSVFLPWLRRQLEAAGVKFQRIPTIHSLGQLGQLGHAVLINASGLSSLTLTDVEDDKVIMDRTYTIVVKSDYNKMFVRRSATEYSYVFGRHNHTAVLGGIVDPIQKCVRSKSSVREELIHRAHENLPEYFPSCQVNDYDIVEDLTGIRPLRAPSVRVEKELIGNQKVVHAYGTTAGGYLYSFGLARDVARLVDEYVFSL